jgi:hypothetical protein
LTLKNNDLGVFIKKRWLYNLFIKRKTFWVFFFLSFIIFFFWLLAFWPGVMTHDSLQSWSQVLYGNYSNWHPYIYTFYVKFFSLFYESPVSVIIFQILFMSVLGAYVFERLYLSSKNKKLIFFSFIIFIFSIPVGLDTVTLWKDVIYSQLVVFWGILLFFLIKEKKNISNKWIIILLGLLLFFTSTVRHNGVIFLLLIPIFLYLNKLMSNKNLTILTIVAILSFILSQTIVASALKIDMQNNNLLKAGVKLQIVSAILSSNYYVYEGADNPPLDPIFQLLSLEEIKKSYDCRTINSTLFNKNLHQEVLNSEQYRSSFDKIFYRLAIQNIPIVVGDRACVVASLFTGAAQGGDYYNVLDHVGPYPNFPDNLGIKQNIKLPELNILLIKVIKFSTSFPNNFIFYSLLVPFFGFISGLIYFFKKDKAITNYSLFFLVQLPIVFLVLPGPDFRYLYFLHLGFLFYIPMCIVVLENMRKKND